VLLLGILQGILLAAIASILMLLTRASLPHVAFLGRVPGTNSYSDVARHPENEPLAGMIAFRPEVSVLYINADSVLQAVLERLRASGPSTIHPDLSASPNLDLAGSRMLKNLPHVASLFESSGRMAACATCCAQKGSKKR
jgi:SulP family sulfate permease